MRYLFIAAAFAVFAGPALAFTEGELKKFDKDGSGSINTEREAIVYVLHRKSPLYARFDVNADGAIDAAELAQMEAEERRKAFEDVVFADDLDTLRAGRPVTLGALAQRQDKPAAVSITVPTPEPSSRPSSCDGPEQELFVRRDKIDTGIYTNLDQTVKRGDALGAKVSYVRDETAGSDTATIDGAVTVVLARNPCVEGEIDDIAHLSGYALAAWVSADGNLSSVKTLDKSALLLGMDAQFEIAEGALFEIQSLTFSGYFQTDYRGEASAYGARATWQPFSPDWALGSPYPYANPLSDYVIAYWNLQAQADVLHVDEPGLTGLKPGTDYAWLGGVAQLKLDMFPRLFSHRLFSTISYSYFFDAASNDDSDLFSYELGYNLTKDGSTSVSFQYQNGTLKSTAQDVDQYMVNINYKY